MKTPGLDKEEALRFQRRMALQDYTKLYLIFTEGTRTEPLYFAGFKKAVEQARDDVLVEVIGVGRATMRLLMEADRFVDTYGIQEAEIWIVSDKDDFPARDFDGMIYACQKRDDSLYKGCHWHCAWSNACFELWFLLHFSFYQAAATRDTYTKMLKDIFRKRRLGSYAKNRDDLFAVMATEGNPRLAILYARKLYTEKEGMLPSKALPCTSVFLLVEELGAYLPDQWKRRFFLEV